MRKVVPLFVLATLVLGGGLAWRSRADPGRAAPPRVLVALGASDAVGVGAARPAADGWVPLVAAGLPPGTELVNLGVSGATLASIISDQLPVAIDADPDWVMIWAGPNDFRNGVPLPFFSQQLDQLLAALQRPDLNRERLIVVVTMPDLRALPSFARGEPDALDARVREWNAAIAAVAARHAQQVALVDLYGASSEFAAHPEYISGDGFHPSSAGYRRLAELALDTLRRHDQALAR